MWLAVSVLTSFRRGTRFSRCVENVHFYSIHSVDIDSELAQLDTDGYRPLRLAQVPAAIG